MVVMHFKIAMDAEASTKLQGYLNIVKRFGLLLLFVLFFVLGFILRS